VTDNGSLDEAGFLESLRHLNLEKRAATKTPPRPLTSVFPPSSHERPPDPARGAASAPALPERRPRVSADPLPPAEQTGYETFYGFHDRPFGPGPDLRFLYHSAAYDAASETLLTAISRRDIVTVLTGAAGTGKTLLAAAVIDQLDRRTLTSVIRDPHLALDDLLERLLVDFGVMKRIENRARGSRHEELVSALQSFVGSLAALQAAAVIVIDDAHRLAPEVIDYLDILTNAGGALVLILMGEPSLLRALKRPALRGLQERIAARAVLGPLAPDEVGGYIAHRLQVGGESARIDFDEDAVRAVGALSNGVPGVVNAICDRALERGFQSSAGAIDGSIAEAAARDLGFVLASERRALTRALLMYLVLVVLGGAFAAGLFWDRLEGILKRLNW
jgi:general secretion pathway protein A